MPALTHGAFTLYETSAITRYIDLALPGPSLVPADPKAAARLQQVIAIAESCAFRPFVLEVYTHRIFRPLDGLPHDESTIAMTSEGAAFFSVYKALSRWWSATRQTPSFRASGHDRVAP